MITRTYDKRVLNTKKSILNLMLSNLTKFA
jgi:hypothetical protein